LFGDASRPALMTERQLRFALVWKMIFDIMKNVVCFSPY